LLARFLIVSKHVGHHIYYLYCLIWRLIERDKLY
jgi:hypothetical protein